MADTIEERVRQSVVDLNKRYPNNKNYTVVGQRQIGAFDIFTVSFTDSEERHEYENFCVTKGGVVLRSFYYMGDAIGFLSSSFSWKALLVDQFSTVAGFIVVLALVVCLASWFFFRPDEQVPEALWVAISSGLGFLFGAKSNSKVQDRPQP